MSDEKGTTTIWQDRHSGRRRHKLMTKELGDMIPAVYANEDVEDYDSVLAPPKLFSPYTGWRWYITEWDPQTGLPEFTNEVQHLTKVLPWDAAIHISPLKTVAR